MCFMSGTHFIITINKNKKPTIIIKKKTGNFCVIKYARLLQYCIFMHFFLFGVLFFHSFVVAALPFGLHQNNQTKLWPHTFLKNKNKKTLILKAAATTNISTNNNPQEKFALISVNLLVVGPKLSR